MEWVLCICCGAWYRADGYCPIYVLRRIEHSQEIAAAVAQTLVETGAEFATPDNVRTARWALERGIDLRDPG